MNLHRKNGQATVELITTIGFILIIFILVILLVIIKSNESSEIKAFLDAKRIANSVADNIDTISSQGPGYYRYFSIPEDIYGGYDYNITTYENIIEISWADKVWSTQIITSNVTILLLKKGEDKQNCVINTKDKVYIRNSCDKIKILAYKSNKAPGARDPLILSNMSNYCNIDITIADDLNDLNYSNLENYDMLWLSHNSVSTNTYDLNQDAENSIKRYVWNGGRVWMSSSDYAGWNDGWLPYDVGMAIIEGQKTEPTAASGTLFNEPNSIDSDYLKMGEPFINWDSNYTLLAYAEYNVTQAQFLRLDHGSGIYLLTSVDSSIQGYDFNNTPMFENGIKYLDSMFACRS